ncbi:MAG: InlB B-repeat-containing protein, partial [Micrococcales bacterium]
MYRSRVFTALLTALALLISPLVATSAYAANSIAAPTGISITSNPTFISVAFNNLEQTQIDSLGILTYQYSLDEGVTWCDRDDTDTDLTVSPIEISAASDNVSCLNSSLETVSDIAMVSGSTYPVMIRAVTASEEGAANSAIDAFLGYQVEFKSNTEANLSQFVNFPLGAAQAMPANSLFTRNGFSLVGWSSTALGTTEYLPTANFTASQAALQFFAVWEAVVYDVTLDPGDGTLDQELYQFTPGDNALTLPTPELLAYKFDGWYTTALTGGSKIESPYTPTADITLYARWSVDNDLTVVPTSRSVMVGNKITLSTSGGYGTGAITFSVTGTGCTQQGTDGTEVFVASSVATNVTCVVTATKAASTGVPAMTSAPLSLAFVKSVQVATKPQNLKVFSNPESITVNFEAPANALQSLTGGYQYSTDAGRTWFDQDTTLLPNNKTIEMVITDESGAEPLNAAKTYLLRIRAISIIEDAAAGEATTSTQAFLGHSVAFDANGGSGTMPNLNVPLAGQKLLPASNFVLANNRVVGWSSTADGKVEFLNRSLFDG